MDKQRKKTFIILIILGAVLIPTFGISLAMKGPAFFKSLSRIASDGRHFLHIIILGNLIILFILMSIFYLEKYHNLGSTATSISFIFSCFLLELTVLVPYMKEEFILLKNLHNFTAYLSIILLVISLFFFVMTMPRSSRSVFKTVVICLIIVIGIAGFIFEVTGNPSAFFETTLVVLACNLILITIYLLYRNEKAKETGKFNVNYKIVESDINFYAYQVKVPKQEANKPLKLDKKIIDWKEIKRNYFTGFHIENVYIYYDKKTNTLLTGIKDPKNTDEIYREVTFPEQKWAVFELDDQQYKTKQYTWNYIKNNFSENKKYTISSDDYIEKYYITKKLNIRKGEIWIPIIENKENN